MTPTEEVALQQPFSWKEACAPGISAVRHHWAPFLLMQAAAAVLVYVYYHSPAVQAGTESLQRLKSHGGVGFDVISGSISGGLLPQLAKVVTGKSGPINRAFLRDTLYNGFVYAIIAVQVDYFYRMQGVMFGNGIDLLTLVYKNAFDMLVFSPFLCIPTAAILYEWRKASFNLSALKAVFSPGFYGRKVMPLLIPAWCFWVPMLFCVYAMPMNLQFPLSQLAEASWCLLFIFIATSEWP